MSKYISIHFKFNDHMYSVTLKTSVEDITLSMIEDRMYKKLVCEKPLTIVDVENLFLYLMSTDKENRRCFLFVETSERSKQLDKLSRVGKSYVCMNYEDL
ncbi:hypothetical protein N665_0577s0005 [Sinapis alba]|nr:hypothetical protein N665_0577s0005 [Sinapis alba]